MADNGQKLLGGKYSSSCEKLRSHCPVVKVPSVGDIVFFADANKPIANHAGLIYKVDVNTIYTVEGNSPGGQFDCVATKSYTKSYKRIMSYGCPKYSKDNPASKVIDIAISQVGYIEKRTNSKLYSKTANAGNGGYTKYGKWIGVNGDLWSASFICWCFSAAYDTSSINPITSEPQQESQPELQAVDQTRSNSSLVNYVNRISSTSSHFRSGLINCITIHISKKVGTIYDLAEMLNTSKKCYNYGIDNSGTLGLFVDEILWTDSSNSSYNDNRSVNIICMNSTLEPDYKISDECYSKLISLCEDICRRNFIFELKFTNSPETDSVTLHSQFNSKAGCPGKYITNLIPNLVNDINSKLNLREGVNSRIVSARLASSETEALKAQSTVSIKSIKPYVVKLDKSSLGLDYSALKELGVVGVMIDGGQHFNDKHEVVEYRTQNVYKQTLEANYANMPHSYIYTTRARSLDEVKEEAYWFRFIVSKYPPKLGVWLHCAFDTNVSKVKAKQFVEEWYKYFVRWGLKSKCGIYATTSQAKKIGWPDQCAYMPLWLEGELTDSVCPDEELLTPAFFKLDGLTSSSYTDTTDSNSTIEPVVYQIPNSDPKSGSTERDVSKSTKVNNDTYTDISIPSDPKYKGMKKWESYISISTRDEKSYSITHGDDTITDSDGFRMVDGRYLIAVGSGVCTTIGTYLDLILDNGTVIKCIMGDSKPDSRTDPINHIFSGFINDSSYCCSEFIVYNKEGVLNPNVRTSGDCSVKYPEWKSPVKTIRVYTENWFKRGGD